MIQKRLYKFVYSKLAVVLLLVIILLALLERTIGIHSKMILFIFDSARDMLFVKKIVIDHKILLIGPSSGGLQGYYQGVVWYYLLAIPFILGRGDPAAMTLFMACMSTLSVILAFLVMKKLANVPAGLIAATLFAFASFSVATAKFIWNPYPIVWLMPLLFLAFWLFVQKKTIALPLAALLIGLIFNFEAIYGICLLPTLLLLFCWHLLSRQRLKTKLIIALLSVILFAIPFLPMLVFDIRHHFMISKTLLQTLHSGGSGLTHSSQETRTPITQRLLQRSEDLSTYTVGSLTPNLFCNLFLFVIFLCCLLLVIKNKNSQQLQMAGITVFSLLVPYFFFLTLKYAVWSYYWIGNPPLYALLFCFVVGLGLPLVFKQNEYLKKRINFGPLTQIITIAGIFIVVLVYNPFKYLSLWQSGEVQESSQVLKTQLRVVDTIYHDVHGKPYSAYVLTPPVYDYVYRYLFWWEGRGKFAGLKQDEKQRITYLIIEPNDSDPTGTYFRKNVVHTNNAPEKVFHFPGDVIVQKIITSPKESPIDPNYFPQL